SFLNLGATARFIEASVPKHLLLVCSGTLEQMAYEDVLAAGAFCDLLWTRYSAGTVSDSALIACRLFHQTQKDLLAAISSSRNGQRLLCRAELAADVEFCAQRDQLSVVAQMESDGVIRKQA